MLIHDWMMSFGECVKFLLQADVEDRDTTYTLIRLYAFGIVMVIQFLKICIFFLKYLFLYENTENGDRI